MAKVGIAQLGSVNIDQDEYSKEFKKELNKIVLPYLMENNKRKDEFILEQIEKFKIARTDEEREEIRKENYNYNYNYYNNFNYNPEDKFLNLIATCILNALITLKSPGCKYLYLVEDFKAYAL